MRTWIAYVLVATAFWSCGKSDSEPVPVYTSPDGIWTYTTPDKAIMVEFELKTSGSGVLEIVSASIEVSKQPGVAAGQLTNVDLPVIEQIRINANDAGLVVPYAITFNNCSISSTFNFISVADANYTYPWGQMKTLSGISITRK